MFNPTQIKSIAAAGEGYNAEFKVSIPSNVKGITEEVCAFANASGGIVLIGVDDSNNLLQRLLLILYGLDLASVLIHS